MARRLRATSAAVSALSRLSTAVLGLGRRRRGTARAVRPSTCGRARCCSPPRPSARSARSSRRSRRPRPRRCRPCPPARWQRARPASAKLVITAPFITVGSRPSACRIQPIMPVVVDLPLVPATPMRDRCRVEQIGQQLGAQQDSGADRAARPGCRARCPRPRPEATTICSGRVTPVPSCGKSSMPRARRKSNLSAVRPWSSARSEPATRMALAAQDQRQRQHARCRRCRRRNKASSGSIVGSYKRKGMANTRVRIGVVAPAIAHRRGRGRARDARWRGRVTAHASNSSSTRNAFCLPAISPATDARARRGFHRGGQRSRLRRAVGGARRLWRQPHRRGGDRRRSARRRGTRPISATAISGFLLAGLYPRRLSPPRPRAGRRRHQPRRRRGGGERALAYLADRAPEALEPSLADGRPAAAFNLCILSHLLGTPLEPDLSGHVLMLEEVSEQIYRIDRSLFHVTAERQRAQGWRASAWAAAPTFRPTTPHSAADEEAVVQDWCAACGHPLSRPRRHRPRHRQQGGAVGRGPRNIYFRMIANWPRALKRRVVGPHRLGVADHRGVAAERRRETIRSPSWNRRHRPPWRRRGAGAPRQRRARSARCARYGGCRARTGRSAQAASTARAGSAGSNLDQRPSGRCSGFVDGDTDLGLHLGIERRQVDAGKIAAAVALSASRMNCEVNPCATPVSTTWAGRKCRTRHQMVRTSAPSPSL